GTILTIVKSPKDDFAFFPRIAPSKQHRVKMKIPKQEDKSKLSFPRRTEMDFVFEWWFEDR
ncbi:hypothetical protein HK102_009512, partial [Quaeritorhiza haematococci]